MKHTFALIQSSLVVLGVEVLPKGRFGLHSVNLIIIASERELVNLQLVP